MDPDTFADVSQFPANDALLMRYLPDIQTMGTNIQALRKGVCFLPDRLNGVCLNRGRNNEPPQLKLFHLRLVLKNYKLFPYERDKLDAADMLKGASKTTKLCSCTTDIPCYQ